eukprot:jgi/Ulvmu1/4836/UM020_0122.1
MHRRTIATAASALQDQMLSSLHDMPGDPTHGRATAPCRAKARAVRARLNRSEWSLVELRFKDRGHASMECCVCCEQFVKPGEQILTSCAHTFHKRCLDSWERFSKNHRCCPVCRTDDYGRKKIDYGYTIYLERCVTLIQAHWRRVLAGKRFRSLWARAPRPSTDCLQKKWLHNRLAHQSDYLISAMNEDGVGDLDMFFAALDRDVQSARHACDMHVASVQSPLAATQANVLPTREANSNSCLESSGRTVDWEQIHAVARSRGTDDCPICMVPLQKGASPVRGSLLSCSHAFHQTCIMAFERFELARDCTPTCPVCRHAYTKTDLTMAGLC